MRSGHKALPCTARQPDSLPGQSQGRVDWGFGHSTLVSFLLRSTQADIHKQEFCENFILVLFSLCKAMPSVLTSCLTSSFFSEMPSCENVEKNRTVPCYQKQYLLGQDPLTDVAPRSHSIYEVMKSWFLRDWNKLK